MFYYWEISSWERFTDGHNLLVVERGGSQKKSSAKGIFLLDDCCVF